MSIHFNTFVDLPLKQTLDIFEKLFLSKFGQSNKKNEIRLQFLHYYNYYKYF